MLLWVACVGQGVSHCTAGSRASSGATATSVRASVMPNRLVRWVPYRVGRLFPEISEVSVLQGLDCLAARLKQRLRALGF